MAAETSGPIAIPAMQISGINTKVATPANIPTPIIVLELNAIAYPHETPVPLYLIRSSLMVCGDIARLGAVRNASVGIEVREPARVGSYHGSPSTSGCGATADNGHLGDPIKLPSHSMAPRHRMNTRPLTESAPRSPGWPAPFHGAPASDGRGPAAWSSGSW